MVKRLGGLLFLVIFLFLFSYPAWAVTASGSWGGKGDSGQVTISFPAKGGKVTGHLKGTYVYTDEIDVIINYSGSINGTYSGGKSGVINATYTGKYETIPYKAKGVISGNCKGNVDGSGRITGTYASNILGQQGAGTFELTYSVEELERELGEDKDESVGREFGMDQFLKDKIFNPEWDENTKKAYIYFVSEYLDKYAAKQETFWILAKIRELVLNYRYGTDVNSPEIVEEEKRGRCGDYSYHLKGKLGEEGVKSLFLSHYHDTPLGEYSHAAVIIPPRSYYEQAEKRNANDPIYKKVKDNLQTAERELEEARRGGDQKEIKRAEKRVGLFRETLQKYQAPDLEEIYSNYDPADPINSLPEEWRGQPVLDGYTKKVMLFEDWVKKYRTRLPFYRGSNRYDISLVQ